MSGKMQAVVLLGVMYTLGVVSGVAWHSYRVHHSMSPRAMFAEHRINRLKNQLHLSTAQEQAMRDIFQKAHERATQVNEEVSWDLADIHRDSVEAIRQVLTPEQMKQFDVLHQKFHAKHKHMPEDTPGASAETPRAGASK